MIRFPRFVGIVCVFETIAFAAPRTEICLALVSAITVRIEPFDLPVANKWMVATNHESQSAGKFLRCGRIVEVPLVPCHGERYGFKLTNDSVFESEFHLLNAFKPCWCSMQGKAI